MMIKLKPCPFCGGEAHVVALQSMPPSFQVLHVCEVAAKRPTDTAEEAIEAWNTRAERTCRVEKSPDGYGWNGECGNFFPPSVPPRNFCPRCGGKVVEE